MKPGLRKASLCFHVLASVGWFGAVLAFLVLAIAALGGAGLGVREGYIAMDLLARWVILPLCLVSFATGVLESLITKWGLWQHYWVVFKLLLNALSTLVLLGHMRPIAALARLATHSELGAVDEYAMRLQITLDAGAALVVLVIASALAVYKPRGVTAYGWRKQQGRGVSVPG